MKKKMIILILLIISFTIFVNTGNRTLTCNELFLKKLWISKTHNYSLCTPYNYFWSDAYWHSNDSVNFDDWLYKVWLFDSFDSDFYFESCFWKKWKKYLLWKVKVLDCFDKDTKKYKNSEFKLKGNIYFTFNKNNKEHIKIINSIKTLTQK